MPMSSACNAFWRACSAFVPGKMRRHVFRQRHFQTPPLQSAIASLQSKLELSLEMSVTTAELHRKTFANFKGIHCGQDLVLVATGPSLANYKPLNGAIHIGLNHAFKRTGFNLDYLFAQDYSAVKGAMSEMNNYRRGDCTKFYGLARELETLSNIVIPESDAIDARALRYRSDWWPITDPRPSRFAFDLTTQILGSFGSIAFPALQFALWTNPRRIYLVGCDCSSGHFFDDKGDLSYLIEPYRQLKGFADRYYPSTEIVSVNPVGLKGLFKEIYQ